MRVRLENKRNGFLPDIIGRNFWNFRLLGCRYTGDEVHLAPFADLGLLDDLVAEIQSKEDGDVDI